MPIVIPVSVRGKIASAPKDTEYVCGNSDYIIHFDFSEEWKAHDLKTARFKYNGTYREKVFNGNECPVPIISDTFGIEVGVYAGNLETTTAAYIPAKKSILCEEGLPADPPSDVYAQLVSLTEEARAAAKDVQQRADDGEFDGQDGAPGKDGVSASAMTNGLHNADFTQFVAQAGICQVHAGGSVTFAGDRWELVSGTLTAEANANGNGYGKVTLNGTIRQKVEMPPAEGFAYVSTLSGEASAEYADGVITITGSGAVLDQAWLYAVEHDKPPVRRGYSAELMDCYRFYIYFAQSNALSYVGFAQSSTEARFTMPLPVPLRLSSPTYQIRWRTTMQMYPGAVTPEAINGVTVVGNTASISLKSSGLTGGAVMTLKTNAVIELCCDL